MASWAARRERWLAAGIDPSSLPSRTQVPSVLPRLFTTQIPDGIPPFANVQLTADGTDLNLGLIVLGVIPDDPRILYVLDPASANVLQIDPAAKNTRGANSTFRQFVDFLERIDIQVQGTDGDLRAALDADLREVLESVDPAAFEPGNRWRLVFEKLGA